MKKNNNNNFECQVSYILWFPDIQITALTMNWRSFIQMVIIQMAAHIVNNHIIMAFYIDCIHHDSNYTLIISHTDGNHTDTVTFPTKHANIYEKCKKKKGYLAKKTIAKLRPIRWQVRHAPSRERARIQMNNLLCIFHFFFFFWMISFCLWDCKLQNCDVFYHQDVVFERNLFHNGHKQ